MSTAILPVVVPTPVVGTSSVQVVPANPARQALAVFNANAVANIAICPLGTTPAINGAGSITIPPGLGVTLTGWTAGANAIADTPGSAITLYEF